MFRKNLQLKDRCLLILDLIHLDYRSKESIYFSCLISH